MDVDSGIIDPDKILQPVHTSTQETETYSSEKTLTLHVSLLLAEVFYT
jgi:hypothetical protein